MSLTMFSAVSRSISSAFFRPTAVWCATACSSSASSSSKTRSCAMQQSRPSCSSPAASGAIRSSSSTAPVRPPRISAISCAARAGRAASSGGSAPARFELVRVGVDPPDLARVGAEQLARAARDRVVEVLAQRDRRERLAQLRERRERVDPPARALVELRVLDRARHERRGVHEKVEHSVVELARRLVWRTTTPITSPSRASTGTATIDWNRSSSSSGTYFMRGSSSALSRMNSGVFVRATQPVSPSSTPQPSVPTRCE